MYGSTWILRPPVCERKTSSRSSAAPPGCRSIRPMTATRGSSFDSELDALFQRPLAEFIAARNALAGRLRKEGRAVEAERVKALAKPSTPAWTVNQLFWENPKAFDRLVAVTERVRKALTGLTRNA